ncbi:PKD domain-containing protein [Fulvivirgaceae bacterium BMA12]|uniref:PKD domain-containing protein n=1 Tax=Agaribacillus aureus TaxID=3051825 RepID=A0ABT8KY81_9BACT|nr:PKD domain-containing protein [Fulvivirgaceae bacterium BMA12]
MKNKMFRYIFVLLTGLVILAHAACDDDLEKDLKIISFFKVHQGNEDDIYFLNEPVEFYNYSLHATDYLWDFGDGTQVSTEKEPIHVFTEEGKFVVSLKVSDGINATTYADTLTIVVDPG